MPTFPVFNVPARLLLLTGLISLLSGCGGGGGPEEGVTVSGTISIEAGTRVDSDNADDALYRTSVSNNLPVTAQLVPVPGIVGGYLSGEAGTYPEGGDYPQDTDDYFTGPFEAGDLVLVQFFPSEVGLNIGQLCLTLPGRAERCSDTGLVHDTYQQEAGGGVIHLRTTGTEPLRYVLQVNPSGVATEARGAYTEPELLLNEAVVMLEPGSARTMAASVLASMDIVRPLAENTLHVRRPQSLRTASVAGQDRRTETVSWIRDLRQQGISAEPNYLYRTQAVTPQTNPLYSRQVNLAQISVPLAWQLAPTAGAGVGVAVMDTGLFTASPNHFGNWHPDLDINVVAGPSPLDFVSELYDQDLEPGPDNNPATPANGLPQSTSFHGTHVAGIIAAADNNIGVVGVAPAATILPYRVLGSRIDSGLDGVGSGADLIAAINAAAVRDDVHVINLSLGGLGPSTALETAVNLASANGQLVIAAAGNSGESGATYPARFASVVGVGALNTLGERTWYSNFGAGVDVYAPGGDSSIGSLIVSTYGREQGGAFTPTYTDQQGTSMAAPHVAGVYALMKSVVPELAPADFNLLLRGGALTDPTPACPDCSLGQINAAKAVNAVLAGGSLSDVVYADPAVVVLPASGLPVMVQLRQFGSEALTLSAEAVIPAPLELVEPAAGLVVGQPLPPDIVIRAQIGRDLDLPEEGVRRTVQIPYGEQGRVLDIPVMIMPVNELADRNAGRHYLLLVDLETGEAVREQAVTARDGQYNFRFDNVAPGEYYLVAGTDLDNNLYICESGEACAEYPVNGLPEALVVDDRNLSGVRLDTSFQRDTVRELGLPRYGFEGYRRIGAPPAENGSGRRLP